MAEDALHTVVVAKKAIEATGMVSFELVDPEGSELPAFSAGSHIDVAIPGGMVRQYSLCNSEADRSRYIIGVWKDPNSRGGSKAMNDVVKEGDTLQVSEPRNRFRVPRHTQKALLIARGIGVTPMLSIADHLKAQGIPFAFHYLNSLGAPGAFHTMIKDSAFADETTLYLEMSDHNLDPAKVLADQPEDMQLFLCGADWWLDAVTATAKQKGFTDERIHIERFAAKPSAPLLDKVFEVKIASTGKVYKITGDKSVTACLEELGVKVPTSCEQGVCGTCKVKILEGEADHRDKRLKDEDRAQGYFLACVSRAKGDMLVLDL